MAFAVGFFCPLLCPFRGFLTERAFLDTFVPLPLQLHQTAKKVADFATLTSKERKQQNAVRSVKRAHGTNKGFTGFLAPFGCCLVSSALSP